MTLAESAVGGIVHDKKRSVVLHPNFVHPHNIRVYQTCNSACPSEESFLVIACRLHLQHFDSCPSLDMQMFAKVDLCEASRSQQADQAIVTKLLSHAVCHALCPLS